MKYVITETRLTPQKVVDALNSPTIPPNSVEVTEGKDKRGQKYIGINIEGVTLSPADVMKLQKLVEERWLITQIGPP